MSVRGASDQNRHRLADGWQGSTIRSILENHRYTGYAVFGRWARQEMLLDPDDIAAGHVVRFRRAAPDRVVRSRRPAHPQIVTVETFTRAQLTRHSRAAGGLATARRAERGSRATARDYALRGLVRCGICERKMQGATIRAGAYYRCTARTMAPGSALLSDHPKTVNLREGPVVAAVNDWIGQLFDRSNIDATVTALLDSQAGQRDLGGQEGAKRRTLDGDARIRRFQDAIAAGVDPAALVDPLNRAQAERAAARAEIDNAPARTTLADAEVYAMIDSLGDVRAALRNADPTSMHQLYRRLDLSMRFEPAEQAVYVTARPRVDSACVRGGSCTLVDRRF